MDLQPEAPEPLVTHLDSLAEEIERIVVFI